MGWLGGGKLYSYREIAPAFPTHRKPIFEAELSTLRCGFPSSFLSLSSSHLATLQIQLVGVHFIIIDEKTMLGLRTLTPDCVRFVLEALSLPFKGGLHLSLFGDFAQLPPVGDRTLYCPASTASFDGCLRGGSLSRDGKQLYQLFMRK